MIHLFSKLVIATDGSDHSYRASHYAVELADKFNGKLDVVYVIEADTSRADVIHHQEKLALANKHKDKIQEIKRLFEKYHVSYHIHLLYGDAGRMLLRFIEENETDCIVMGSRGLNNLQTFILGSVSHKVAKQAACPVLIVK